MSSLETSTIPQSSRTCKHKKSEVNLIAHQSALSWVDNYIPQLVLLPVDYDGSDLLVHEDQDGHQQGGQDAR